MPAAPPISRPAPESFDFARRSCFSLVNLLMSAVTIATYSLEETIEQMFGLAESLRLRGQVSLEQLAESTGYPRHRETIDVARLQAAIRGRQGLIDSWLAYSAEKEADYGWFFEGADEGVYLVGCRKHSIEGPRQLTDPAEACARFIKGEFEALLGVHHCRTAANH